MVYKLNEFEIFKDFPRSELAKLEQFCKFKGVAANQVIYEQNQPCRKVYLVIEGRIKLISKSGKSNGNIIQFVNVDEAFCLLSIFSTQGYLTQAVSCEESLLLAISSSKLLRYLQTNRLLLWRIASTAVQTT